MSRYRFPAFNTASTPRYVVVWDLQWQLLERAEVEPQSDLGEAMATPIKRLAADGWIVERPISSMDSCLSAARWNGGFRCLTPHDPHATIEQSFSPFRWTMTYRSPIAL